MSIILKPVSRDTLTSQATETIKQFILEGNMEPGTKLPGERELSEMLAVSRNILREALSALAAEGIIVKQIGRGTFIEAFDRDAVLASLAQSTRDQTEAVSVQDLREARAALEIGAAGLIVERVTPAELADLRQIIERHETKGQEGKSTIKEDIDFHLVLLKAAKNPVIAEMAPLVVELFRRTVAEAPGSVRYSPERIILEHRAILTALEQRSLPGVREAMRRHYHLQETSF